MGDRLKKLTNLVINRVAFVPKGDNPHAEVMLWKTRGGAVTKNDDALKALDGLGARIDAAGASLGATLERSRALGGAPETTVAKADAAAGRLRTLAEKDLDRRPLDGHGELRTIEQALASVARTREGKRALAGGDRARASRRRATPWPVSRPGPRIPRRGTSPPSRGPQRGGVPSPDTWPSSLRCGGPSSGACSRAAPCSTPSTDGPDRT